MNVRKRLCHAIEHFAWLIRLYKIPDALYALVIKNMTQGIGRIGTKKASVNDADRDTFPCIAGFFKYIRLYLFHDRGHHSHRGTAALCDIKTGLNGADFL